MPTRSKSGNNDLPNTIQHSDKHAQDIFKRARASAKKTYGEGASEYRVAYAALKHEYKKQGDHWVKKDKKGPSDPQAVRGPTTRHKSTDEPRAPTARGKVAKNVADAKKKAQQARKEYARNYRKK